MEILVELLKVLAMLGVFVVVALLTAALFIIMLAIATGIDRNIQPGEDQNT